MSIKIQLTSLISVLTISLYSNYVKASSSSDESSHHSSTGSSKSASESSSHSSSESDIYGPEEECSDAELEKHVRIVMKAAASSAGKDKTSEDALRQELEKNKACKRRISRQSRQEYEHKLDQIKEKINRNKQIN